MKVYLLHQVGEIRSAVEDPVLECVTREETVCHTTFITQYSPVQVRLGLCHSLSLSTGLCLSQESICHELFEKKCEIELTEITVKETVTTCRKPLHKVCPGRKL